MPNLLTALTSVIVFTSLIGTAQAATVKATDVRNSGATQQQLHFKLSAAHESAAKHTLRGPTIASTTHATIFNNSIKKTKKTAKKVKIKKSKPAKQGKGSTPAPVVTSGSTFTMASVVTTNIAPIFTEQFLVASSSINPPFNTTPSAVPVPAAAWLFGSGLLGLVAAARSRRR